MASKEINLLQKDIYLSPENKRWKELVYKFLTPILVFYAGVLVVIISFNITLSTQINAKNNQIQTELQKISNLSKNESIYILVKQKATALTQIMSNRYPYGSLFDYFQLLNQKGDQITSLSMDNAGNISMTVIIPNTDSLDNFINSLTSEADKRFASIKMGDIAYKAGNAYNISFNIQTAEAQ